MGPDGHVSVLLVDLQLDIRLTLGSSPSSLSNVEATAYSPAVGFAGLRIYKPLLCLDDCARFALVIDTEDFAPDLELATFAGDRNWLVKLKLALAIEDMLCVELGYAIDGLGVGPSVKVDYFLVCMLEGQNDGVCRKGSKLRMQFLVQWLALDCL